MENKSNLEGKDTVFAKGKVHSWCTVKVGSRIDVERGSARVDEVPGVIGERAQRRNFEVISLRTQLHLRSVLVVPSEQ